MEITDKTKWLNPVRLRAAGKVLPSRNVGVVFEPIISRGETRWEYPISHHLPNRVVGAEIVCAGPDKLADGRFEFWLVNDVWKDNPNPFIYFVFENVEWMGSLGLADTRFGFMGVKSKTSGWSEYKAFRSDGLHPVGG